MDDSAIPAFFYFALALLSVPIHLLVNTTHATFLILVLKKKKKKNFLFLFIRNPVDVAFPEKEF